MLLSGHRLNEKHHGTVGFFHKNFGSPHFWQLFKYFKKEGGNGSWILWGCVPLFVSVGEMKKVDVTQGFVSLSFKTIIENNVQ